MPDCSGKPDLGTSSLQKLTADDKRCHWYTGRQRVNKILIQTQINIARSINFIQILLQENECNYYINKNIKAKDGKAFLASRNLSSADNICKQFEPSLGPTKCQSSLSSTGSILYNTDLSDYI